ncbi:hypothetical protein HBH72_229360 [Parastagonospora nodorum]|nr:hypothetical protein HBH72_229360 [Parastagonospora nodorum]
MAMQEDDRPSKRQKLDDSHPQQALAPTNHHLPHPPRSGLGRAISPPPSTRQNSAVTDALVAPTWGFDNLPKEPHSPILQPEAQQETPTERATTGKAECTDYVSSPFQLTHIQDLGPRQNVDAVRLGDILGHPMIKECWNFNFLHDIDFVMKHFDEDVRDLVKVKFIHGFWKNEDERRIALLEAAERYPNIQLLHAYIPDPFGTHHSKMLVLFTHDEQAQVVIHTANMIFKDWGNMTQAVWRSPMLPLLPSSAATDKTDDTAHPVGSGARFKVDLLRYFSAYGKRLHSLTKQLRDYDFSSIKAAFIGSVPSRQKPIATKPAQQTSFGWLGLEEILSNVPITANAKKASAPHIVMQVSSIATLGAAPTWLNKFQSVLCRSAAGQLEEAPAASSSKPPKLWAKGGMSSAKQDKPLSPKFNIIFPTSDEVRTSLDGYDSGSSIHMKLLSIQQQKQLEYLHPLFCHWKATPDSNSKGQAMRGPAAPHIKTYIRYSDEKHKTIDWAMVTSANLSKQAWGDVVNKKDETWIQSWEAGVVVWPELFAESKEAIMVPVFGKDMPGTEDVSTQDVNKGVDEGQAGKTVIGFRMPYDLPLTPYTAKEKPWCAQMPSAEPDWMGRAWPGY